MAEAVEDGIGEVARREAGRRMIAIGYQRGLVKGDRLHLRMVDAKGILHEFVDVQVRDCYFLRVEREGTELVIITFDEQSDEVAKFDRISRNVAPVTGAQDVVKWVAEITYHDSRVGIGESNTWTSKTLTF